MSKVQNYMQGTPKKILKPIFLMFCKFYLSFKNDFYFDLNDKKKLARIT